MAVRETRLTRAREAWGPLILGVIVAALIYSWSKGASYRQDVVVLAGVYALTSLGMYLPFNLAGSLSMAYAGYVTIGAYAVGVVSLHTRWPLLWGWVFGAVVAAVIAVLLGVVTMRLSGFYLAGVTLLAGSVFTALIIDQKRLTKGAEGIQGIRYLFLGSMRVSRSMFVTISIIVVLAVAFLLDRLRRSPVGSTVIASKHAPRMVDSLGISTAVLRLVCLGAGAGIAALGGSLFSSFNRVIRPETFPMQFTLIAIFMPLLGGASTALGAALGAVIVTDLTVNHPEFAQYGPLIFAGLVVIVLLVAPQGVAGALNKVVQAVGRAIVGAVRR